MLTHILASATSKDTAQNAKQRPYPRFAIGFSLGINNPVGYLGIQTDVAITEHWSAGTGIGLSTWGRKTFLEGRYYPNGKNRGWALAGGGTYNTGSQGLRLENIDTEYGYQDAVVIDQNPQFNAMISAYYFFKMGRKNRNRFHLQGGYSFPLGQPTYHSNKPLSETGDQQILYLAPGGFILGLGFSFD